MADNTYDAKTPIQRGRIVRILYSQPALATGLAIDFTGGIWATNGGAAFFGTNTTNTNSPDQTSIINLKQAILEKYKYFLDGLGTGISKNISDVVLGNMFPKKDLKEEDSVPSSVFNMKTGFGDDALNEVGLGKIEKERKIKETAITTPDNYIREVNEDLRSIDQQALTVYQNSYFKYHVEYRYPSDEAKRLALSDMNTYREILMKQHEAIYGKKEYEDAKSRIIKNVV